MCVSQNKQVITEETRFNQQQHAMVHVFLASGAMQAQQLQHKTDALLTISGLFFDSVLFLCFCVIVCFVLFSPAGSANGIQNGCPQGTFSPALSSSVTNCTCNIGVFVCCTCSLVLVNVRCCLGFTATANGQPCLSCPIGKLSFLDLVFVHFLPSLVCFVVV